MRLFSLLLDFGGVSDEERERERDGEVEASGGKEVVGGGRQQW